MFYVYILKSLKNGKHYIGNIEDLKRWLEDHNRGKSKSVRNRGPFEIVFKESFDNKAEAVKREKQIKSFKGGEAFKKLINGYAQRDLNPLL